MIASILIPTLPERVERFTALFNELYRQLTYMNTVHPTLGEIEIIVDDSKRFLDGGLSIGKKREALVQRAEGKYCWFLDDDETIAPNYLETLVRLCNQNADVCTFRAIAKLDNYWALFDMSLKNKVNEDSTPDRTVLRGCWHICPVKTKYAKLYSFPDTSYGEDWEWMSKVLTHCQSEAHSDAVILQYNHSSKTSEADKITNYVQSELRGETHS
jgi:glycosyltransferase involved in cell wall biosynthesis